MKKQCIFLIVLLISLIVFSSGCNNNETIDIRGTWNLEMIISNKTITGALTFSGDLAYGTVTYGTNSGKYFIVNYTSIDFTLDVEDSTLGTLHYSFLGSFADNSCGGTVNVVYLDMNNQSYSGTFHLNR
jgi:hypothetical protein